jgi:hypothetical protein
VAGNDLWGWTLYVCIVPDVFYVGWLHLMNNHTTTKNNCIGPIEILFI